MLTSLLGIRLKEERERQGLSQADAALRVGVSREAWGKWERGVMPGADKLLALGSERFDVNYILGGSRTVSASSLEPEEETLIIDFRDTDDEGRAAISRTAKLEADRVRAPRLAAFKSPSASEPQPAITIKRSKVGNVAGRDVHVSAPAKKAKR